MKTQKTMRAFIELNIADIVSAAENLRDAVPRLSNEGYGVFEGTKKQQEPLVSLALSSDSLQQKKYTKLIEEHEPEIKSLADNMVTMGLLEPIRVRAAEEKDKYDLIFGCRRLLAWLYNYAKSAGKIPARMTAEVAESDAKESLLTSLSENMRREPSPIDEAKSFKRLEKAFGMKPREIANVTGKDESVVRERLKLLKLPPDLQEKVHMGKIAQKKALAFLVSNQNKDGMASADRPRLPPIKEIEWLYKAQQDELSADYKPLVTEEVRRLFAYWLKVKYAPRTEAETPATSGEPAQSQASGQ